MSLEENKEDLLNKFSESFGNSTLIKLTLSNKRLKASDLNNVFIRPVVIREQAVLQFTYRHATRDITSNYPAVEAAGKIDELLKESFLNADLFTAEADYTLLSNKKRQQQTTEKGRFVNRVTVIPPRQAEAQAGFNGKQHLSARAECINE